MSSLLADAETEARRIVNDWSMGAAAIGWVPGSSIYLAYNQYEMCESVARAFGVQEAAAEATFAAIAGTVVGRTAADFMLSVIPVVGWAIKAGVAAATTKAIGEGIIAHYRERSPYHGVGLVSSDVPLLPEPAPSLPPPPLVASNPASASLPLPASGSASATNALIREFSARPRMRVLRRSGNYETVFAEATLGARDRGSFAALQGATAPLTDIEYDWDSATLSLVLHVSGQSEIYLRPDQTKVLMKIPRVRVGMPAAVPIGPGDELFIDGWAFYFS